MTTSALTISPGRSHPPALPLVHLPDKDALRRRTRAPMRLGYLIVLLFVVGFGAWSVLAPLAGGAVAPGIISPDGSRKTVQHLEGGIIEKLLIRDGDIVKVGQPLIHLESVQARATYELLLGQQRTLLATKTRLEAERLGLGKLEFPPELEAMAETAAGRAVLNGQRHMFQARKEMHAGRQNVLNQRIQQLEEQIIGYNAQVKSTSRQLALISEEVEGKEQLAAKGIVPKPELLKLQRAEADVLGRFGEYSASIARAQQQIGETHLQLMTLDAERADQIATQLDQTRADLVSTEERLAASKDILSRTVLTAPVSGTVVNLKFKTEGGVLQRGEPILDIVPAEDALLIDARVAPFDVDVVHPGLKAQIYLTAYTARSLPRFVGVVRSISADRLVDDVTKTPYYLARVEVDREQFKGFQPAIELIPGMPAEVLIVTGERTMLQYLMKPFFDAFWRSFRET